MPKDVLDAVGPRLRALRRQRRVTLAQLSAATGISVSTLSRLESGGRRPTLELLLPLARVHQVALDELVGAPATGGDRVHPRPIIRFGVYARPLDPTPRRATGVQGDDLPGARSRPETRPSRSTRVTSGCTCSPGACGSCSASMT